MGLQGARSTGGGLDEELYRLVGKIVCVEQEVANKVEMCVASKRNEAERHADMPGGGRGAVAAAGVPGSSARIREKVKYLKYYWGEMESGRRHGVSVEQFVSYIIESDSNRGTVAHSTVVHNDGTLTNVQEDRDSSAADLEGFLRGAYRALDAIDRLCAHMGLDDYAEYVRQRREAGRRKAGGAGGLHARVDARRGVGGQGTSTAPAPRAGVPIQFYSDAPRGLAWTAVRRARGERP